MDKPGLGAELNELWPPAGDLVALQFPIRSYGRTELALSPAARSLPGQRHRAEFRQVLFVAMDLDVASGEAVMRDDLERQIRAQVERQYARHGIPSVDHDLQIL